VGSTPGYSVLFLNANSMHGIVMFASASHPDSMSKGWILVDPDHKKVVDDAVSTARSAKHLFKNFAAQVTVHVKLESAGLEEENDTDKPAAPQARRVDAFNPDPASPYTWDQLIATPSLRSDSDWDILKEYLPRLLHRTLAAALERLDPGCALAKSWARSKKPNFNVFLAPLRGSWARRSPLAAGRRLFAPRDNSFAVRPGLGAHVYRRQAEIPELVAAGAGVCSACGTPRGQDHC